jgi:hypothetical protein
MNNACEPASARRPISKVPFLEFCRSEYHAIKGVAARKEMNYIKTTMETLLVHNTIPLD